MSSMTRLWFSPTLCGCVLRKTHTWRFSQSLRERLAITYTDDPGMAELWLESLREKDKFDDVTTTHEIVRQCAGHGHFATPDQLAAELGNHGQNAHSPSTCGCTVVYHFDKRLPQEERIHHPLEHPVHTKRCPRHAHLTDPAEHHAAVIAECQAAALAPVITEARSG